MLNSNLLKCFLAVLEHKTLVSASVHLCISQPALSKSLRRLEDEVGVPLFERTHAGMVPTSFGIALSQRAKSIELEARRAMTELALLKDGGPGSLVIGAGPSWMTFGLAETISTMINHDHRIRLRVIPGVLDTLLPPLLNGEIDVVCASLDFPDHPELVKEHLLESKHVILAHESHPLFGRELVHPRDLQTCRFIGIQNDFALLERMRRFFSMRGLTSPPIAVEVGSLEMVLSLVATGQFVFSSSLQVLNWAKPLGIGPLGVVDSFWNFQGGMVYRKVEDQTPALKLFRKCLAEITLKSQADLSSHRPTLGEDSGQRK